MRSESEICMLQGRPHPFLMGRTVTLTLNLDLGWGELHREMQIPPVPAAEREGGREKTSFQTSSINISLKEVSIDVTYGTWG